VSEETRGSTGAVKAKPTKALNNPLANEESEGSRMQTAAPRDTNPIRGELGLSEKAERFKTHSIKKSQSVYGVGIWRERLCSYPGRPRRSRNAAGANNLNGEDALLAGESAEAIVGDNPKG